MPKYLFTSDQRISSLPDRIQWVANYINSGHSVTEITEKSDNNNATTLKFYYNLHCGTKTCEQAAINPIYAIRNFVLKFQFPNVRTQESLFDTISEHVLLAPFRSVVSLLDAISKLSGNSESFLSLNEILYYVFCNKYVYCNPSVNYNSIAAQIIYARHKNAIYDSLISSILEWNQYNRQARELFMVLTYASKCFTFSKGNLRFSPNHEDYEKDKDFIHTILMYNKFWYPSNINDFRLSNLEYISYMNTENTPYSVIEFTPNLDTPQSTNKFNNYQQIFYGAPGTGKSHKIKDDADVKVANRKNLVFRTTFHPDSDYSTFVGAYKPTTSKSGIRGKQPILDYDSLVDKFKEYLNVPNVNITKACTLFGFDYHDSIIRIQENGRKVMDLVNDAYKSNTSYDSVVRGGMACYEQNPIQENGSKITYEFVPQAFTNAYMKAWNTDENVYLIIEEINRGNCAQIFGDLFQLLDRKNGISEYPVEADTDLQNYLQKALADTTRTDIPDEVKSGKKLMLPSNLYIWATMNTSDQSLFPIDSAFKRRWEWKYIKIKEGKDENGNKLDWKVDVKMDESGTLLPWWDFIKKINEIIASMTSSADKQLGYFFCCAKDGVIDEETFVSKVIFYLWNDVFKDYGFEDASLFRYTTKDEDGKDTEKDLTFPDFYNEEGEKVNTERLTDFVKKVMSWKVDNKKDED